MSDIIYGKFLLSNGKIARSREEAERSGLKFRPLTYGDLIKILNQRKYRQTSIL